MTTDTGIQLLTFAWRRVNGIEADAATRQGIELAIREILRNRECAVTIGAAHGQYRLQIDRDLVGSRKLRARLRRAGFNVHDNVRVSGATMDEQESVRELVYDVVEADPWNWDHVHGIHIVDIDGGWRIAEAWQSAFNVGNGGDAPVPRPAVDVRSQLAEALNAADADTFES